MHEAMLVRVLKPDGRLSDQLARIGDRQRSLMIYES